MLFASFTNAGSAGAGSALAASSTWKTPASPMFALVENENRTIPVVSPSPSQVRGSLKRMRMTRGPAVPIRSPVIVPGAVGSAMRNESIWPFTSARLYPGASSM